MTTRRIAAPILVLVALLAVLVGTLTMQNRDADPSPRQAGGEPSPAEETPEAALPDTDEGEVSRGGQNTSAPDGSTGEVDPVAAQLPGGGRKIFGRNRFLVAYYGTAGTGVLGVLGEDPPGRMHPRLMRAARKYTRPGETVVPVYELIVTIADAHPGKGGQFNHDITRREVRTYIKAAERNGALLVLDLQPGREDFLTVAKRWKWALKHPHVGLALDPEWRMGPRQTPGRVIGSVRANEVNRVSAWLESLTVRNDLPEKIFMLHQFRSSMILNPKRIVDRPHLAEVLHVDGFGTQSQKLETYGALARPRQFAMGFKLFYDEDVPLMRPGAVHKIRPKVRFISFQ